MTDEAKVSEQPWEARTEVLEAEAKALSRHDVEAGYVMAMSNWDDALNQRDAALARAEKAEAGVGLLRERALLAEAQRDGARAGLETAETVNDGLRMHRDKAMAERDAALALLEEAERALRDIDGEAYNGMLAGGPDPSTSLSEIQDSARALLAKLKAHREGAAVAQTTVGSGATGGGAVRLGAPADSASGSLSDALAQVSKLREALSDAAKGIAINHECPHCNTESGGHQSDCPYSIALADTASAAQERDKRIRREAAERMRDRCARAARLLAENDERDEDSVAAVARHIAAKICALGVEDE